MNASVLSSLLPVVLLIATGFVASKADWVRAGATKDLSNLVFVVLTPALLFRTMSTVRVQQLEFAPVAIYFAAAALLFADLLYMQLLGSIVPVQALVASHQVGDIGGSIAALARPGESAHEIVSGMDLGSFSMRSFSIS